MGSPTAWIVMLSEYDGSWVKLWGPYSDEEIASRAKTELSSWPMVGGNWTVIPVTPFSPQEERSRG